MSDPRSNQEGSKPAATPPAKPNEPFTKTDLDTVFRTEIGEFGKFQLQSLLVAMVLVVFTGVANGSYIFTTGRTDTRCLIPECESKPSTFDLPWVHNAIPLKDKKQDLCNRYSPAAGAPKKADKPGTCPATMFDTKKIERCKEYVYKNTYSVVYDFHLECREWERTFLGTVRKLGTLTALPVTSYISDRWGRRIALVFNAVLTSIIGVQRYWVHTYWAFLIIDFLEGTFGCGLFSCAYVLVVEVFAPKWRVAAGASINTAYSTGQVTLGICAWFCPHWRPLTLLLYMPQIVSVFSYWFITESVRWYMAKGKFDQSEKLLKKMARVNGTSVQDSTLYNLRRTVIDSKEKAAEEAARIGAGPSLVAQVLAHKRVLMRVIISPIWWITTTFIYHGLALNATAVYGNPYQNYIMVSMVEIPGFWIAFYFLRKVGRKPVLTAGYWVCGTCMLGYMFIPKAYQLYVYMVAKCAIAMVLTSVYCYTAELYPTSNRHKLLALASMFGRLGSIIAPLTPALAAQFFNDLPFVLFGCMALISGVLIFFTPETLGTLLPDTFQQAENLGRKEPVTTTTTT